MSQVEVGRKYGVSTRIVIRELKACGIEYRKRRGRKPPEIDRDELYRLYVTKRMTMSEAGEKLGIGRDAVSTAIDRLKIPRGLSPGPKKRVS